MNWTPTKKELLELGFEEQKHYKGEYYKDLRRNKRICYDGNGEWAVSTDYDWFIIKIESPEELKTLIKILS